MPWKKMILVKENSFFKLYPEIIGSDATVANIWQWSFYVGSKGFNQARCWLFVAKHHNEFLLGWDIHKEMALLVHNKGHKIGLDKGLNLENLWRNWHKHCVTWKASGTVKVYF